ncbi:MAG TPA: cell division protein ZapD [Gammaproteobacteria bacterium]
MNSSIKYEQPLNERVRTFLRIEHLFDLGAHFLDGSDQWESRLRIAALLDVVELMGRSDIRNELIKELERHGVVLGALEGSPAVDQQRLHSILRDINQYLRELRDAGSQVGQILRKDELMQSIKQRNAIPGGTCSFDLPNYHFWLNRPADERRAQLEAWQQDLVLVRKALKLALHLIRSSATPSREVAERGFFQKPIEQGTACQLVRVLLPAESRLYPEISAGRHRFTVRFMEQLRTSDRPTQAENDVEFELHCCIL